MENSRAIRSQKVRRRSRFLGVEAISLIGMGLLQCRGVDASFVVGDPIDVVLEAGSSFTVLYDDNSSTAVGLSFQQCEGDANLNLDVIYSGEEKLNIDLESNVCTMFVSEDIFDSSSSGELPTELCVFQSSSDLSRGYETEMVEIESTLVNPTSFEITLSNTGNATSSAQMVMFSTDTPSVDMSDFITRLSTTTPSEPEENIFTMSVTFDMPSTSEEALLSVYYVEVEDSTDADLQFMTTCQAQRGVLTDEIIIEEDSPTIDLCVELPQHTEAVYRVYLVLSFGPITYARVGFGIEEQLLYVSDLLSVSDSANEECPTTTDDHSGAAAWVVPASSTTGAIALSLAVAAAAHAAVRAA